MDRHICRLNNLALKAKSSLDERYLPTHVEYCSGFLIVITNGGQIKILNPETLNCRKVLRFDGIPQVTSTYSDGISRWAGNFKKVQNKKLVKSISQNIFEYFQKKKS